MYESIKDWINVSAVRLPLASKTGTGTRVFGPPIDFLCYPAGKVTTVTNSKGEQVVSNTQLFIDGTQAFGEFDDVIFEGTQRPIKTVATFYRNGGPDIKVLYL